MSDSIEPDFVFLQEPKYTSAVFGLFLSFFAIFILSLRNKLPPIYICVIGPILMMYLCSRCSYEIELIIRYFLTFFNIPFSLLISLLFIRFTLLISRFLLTKLNKPITSAQFNEGKLIPDRSNPLYQIIIGTLSFVFMTTATFLISFGFSPEFLWNGHATYGVAFACLVFSFLFTLVCDNGIISDPCMIFFYTSLFLSPMISASGGMFTVFARLILVITSVISYSFSFNLESSQRRGKIKSQTMEGIHTVFSGIKDMRSKIPFLLLIISYILVSQDVCIRPNSTVCGLQVIITPLIYIIILLHEAGYYDTVTPHVKRR